MGEVEAASGLEETLSYAAKVLSHRELIAAWDAPPQSPLAGFAPSRHRHAISAGEISANRVRDLLGLGEADPVGDLVGLIENHGIPVVHRDLPKDVHGLAVRDERSDGAAWVVFAAVSVPWTRQRCALLAGGRSWRV
jgi:hypothetical protein